MSESPKYVQCEGDPPPGDCTHRTPWATNMCVTSFAELPESLERGAIQVLLGEHHYWGGLHNIRELAGICRVHGVGLAMHSNTHLGISLAAMTHVAAVVPNLDYACDSHSPWQTEDVITERHGFDGGALPVDVRPGLGVELDRGRLRALHQRWLDDDGALTTVRCGTATTPGRCARPTTRGRCRPCRAGSRGPSGDAAFPAPGGRGFGRLTESAPRTGAPR